jgi:hypothetical protein
MKMKHLFLFLIIFFFYMPVFAQNAAQLPAQNADEDHAEESVAIVLNYSPNAVFFINSFNYNVTGITLPFMLNTKTELKIGEEIIGYDKLSAFIEDKKQLLINERVLKDNIRIEYTLGEANEDGKIPVDMEIYTEDTWNIIALPYPKYDSNSGFELTIKARDYNFLGTMNPLRFDFGYRYDQKGRSYYNLMLDTGIPVKLFNLKWHIDFDNDFIYRPDRELEYFYKNSTGISVDLPIELSTLTLSFHEQFIFNDELSEKDKKLYGREFQEGFYLSSKPEISWKIPTPFEVGSFGFLTYTPGITAVINHEIAGWELMENRDGATYTFSHTLGFGRVNWIGNFKKGFSFNISNSFNRFYSFPNEAWDPFYNDLTVSAAGYFIFTDFLGLSSRIMYRHYFNTYNETAGDVIRGILDDEIDAEYIISINIDIPLKALKIRPSEWFPNNKVARIFDFDLHLYPVFDIAFYQSYFKETTFGNENILMGGGIELIIFPQRWRSLFLRISAGWDSSNIDLKTPMEIFIGMDLFY